MTINASIHDIARAECGDIGDDWFSIAIITAKDDICDLFFHDIPVHHADAIVNAINTAVGYDDADS